MKNLTGLTFWLIGYGLSLKDVDKIIELIERSKK